MAKKTKSVLQKDVRIAWHYVVPCMLGGAIALVFSGSWTLAFQVAVAVLIGNYIGYELLKQGK
jgi:hypothetical protein